jgi:hypothetical protein
LQLGHLPIQRALVPPHSVQVNIDLSLAMGEIVPFTGAFVGPEDPTRTLTDPRPDVLRKSGLYGPTAIP